MTVGDIKYLLRGGPHDGETVDPPPGYLHQVAEAVADELGGRHAGPASIVTGDGWVYEFAPDEPGVLIGREQTDGEQVMSKAFDAIRSEQERAQRIAQLAPRFARLIQHTHEALQGDACAALEWNGTLLCAASGATAAEWTKALAALGPTHGAAPQPLPEEKRPKVDAGPMPDTYLHDLYLEFEQAGDQLGWLEREQITGEALLRFSERVETDLKHGTIEPQDAVAAILATGLQVGYEAGKRRS